MEEQPEVPPIDQEIEAAFRALPGAPAISLQAIKEALADPENLKTFVAKVKAVDPKLLPYNEQELAAYIAGDTPPQMGFQNIRQLPSTQKIVEQYGSPAPRKPLSPPPAAPLEGEPTDEELLGAIPPPESQTVFSGLNPESRLYDPVRQPNMPADAPQRRMLYSGQPDKPYDYSDTERVTEKQTINPALFDQAVEAAFKSLPGAPAISLPAIKEALADPENAGIFLDRVRQNDPSALPFTNEEFMALLRGEPIERSISRSRRDREANMAAGLESAQKEYGRELESSRLADIPISERVEYGADKIGAELYKSFIAGGADGLAAVQHIVANAISDDPGNLDEYALADFAKWARDRVDRNMREKYGENYQSLNHPDNFWTNEIPAALGQTLSFAAPGALLKGTKLARFAPGVTGALQSSGQTYAQAQKAIRDYKDGKTDTIVDQSDAVIAAGLSGLVGASDALLFNKIGKYVPKSVSSRFLMNALDYRLGRVGVEAVGEGATEVVQSLADNTIAQQFYDPNRQIVDDNTLKQFLIGAVIGGGVKGTGEAASVVSAAAERAAARREQAQRSKGQPAPEGTPPPSPEPAPEGTPPPSPEPAPEGTPPPSPEPAPEGTPPPSPEPAPEGTPPPIEYDENAPDPIDALYADLGVERPADVPNPDAQVVQNVVPENVASQAVEGQNLPDSTQVDGDVGGEVVQEVVQENDETGPTKKVISGAEFKARAGEFIQDDGNRELFEKLNLDDDIEIVLSEDPNDFSSVEGNRVVINPMDAASDSEIDQENLVMHEITHSATLDALRDPTEPKAKSFSNSVKDLRKQANKKLSKEQKEKLAYGLQSNEEFVSEAFSNPDFRDALKNVSAQGSNALTAWINAVKKFVGLSKDSTVFEKLIAETEKFRSTPPPSKKKGQPKGPAYAPKASLRKAIQDQYEGLKKSDPGKIVAVKKVFERVTGQAINREIEKAKAKAPKSADKPTADWLIRTYMSAAGSIKAADIMQQSVIDQAKKASGLVDEDVIKAIADETIIEAANKKIAQIAEADKAAFQRKALEKATEAEAKIKEADDELSRARKEAAEIEGVGKKVAETYVKMERAVTPKVNELAAKVKEAKTQKESRAAIAEYNKGLKAKKKAILEEGRKLAAAISELATQTETEVKEKAANKKKVERAYKKAAKEIDDQLIRRVKASEFVGQALKMNAKDRRQNILGKYYKDALVEEYREKFAAFNARFPKNKLLAKEVLPLVEAMANAKRYVDFRNLQARLNFMLSNKEQARLMREARTYAAKVKKKKDYPPSLKPIKDVSIPNLDVNRLTSQIPLKDFLEKYIEVAKAFLANNISAGPDVGTQAEAKANYTKASELVSLYLNAKKPTPGKSAKKEKAKEPGDPLIASYANTLRTKVDTQFQDRSADQNLEEEMVAEISDALELDPLQMDSATLAKYLKGLERYDREGIFGVDWVNEFVVRAKAVAELPEFAKKADIEKLNKHSESEPTARKLFGKLAGQEATTLLNKAHFLPAWRFADIYGKAKDAMSPIYEYILEPTIQVVRKIEGEFDRKFLPGYSNLIAKNRAKLDDSNFMRMSLFGALNQTPVVSEMIKDTDAANEQIDSAKQALASGMYHTFMGNSETGTSAPDNALLGDTKKQARELYETLRKDPKTKTKKIELHGKPVEVIVGFDLNDAEAQIYDYVKNYFQANVKDRLKAVSENYHGSTFLEWDNYIPLIARDKAGKDRDADIIDQMMDGSWNVQQSAPSTAASQSKQRKLPTDVTYELDFDRAVRTALRSSLTDIYGAGVVKKLNRLTSKRGGGSLSEVGLNEKVIDALRKQFILQLRMMRGDEDVIDSARDVVRAISGSVAGVTVAGMKNAAGQLLELAPVFVRTGPKYFGVGVRKALQDAANVGENAFNKYLRDDPEIVGGDRRISSRASSINAPLVTRAQKKLERQFARYIPPGWKAANWLQDVIESTNNIVASIDRFPRRILFYATVTEEMAKRGVAAKDINWDKLPREVITRANYENDRTLGQTNEASKARVLQSFDKTAWDLIKRQIVFQFRGFVYNRAIDFYATIDDAIKGKVSPLKAAATGASFLASGMAFAYISELYNAMLTGAAGGNDDEMWARLKSNDFLLTSALASITEHLTGKAAYSYPVVTTAVETANKYARGEEYNPKTDNITFADPLVLKKQELRNLMLRQMLGSSYYRMTDVTGGVEQVNRIASGEDANYYDALAIPLLFVRTMPFKTDVYKYAQKKAKVAATATGGAATGKPDFKKIERPKFERPMTKPKFDRNSLNR